MSNESEVVSRFLLTKNIRLPPANDWLKGCIEWFKSQHDHFSTTELEKFALQQWLLADLRLISHRSLPPNLSDINCIMLPQTYPMQINYFFNVGESAYSQYEKKRKLCLDNQSVGEEKQANWMPKAKRIMKMEMTDGVQTVQGFEYCPLTKLNETMEPGLKVLIKGPVECRKGVLFLKDINIEILGGELDTLCESNPTAEIIAEKLQLDPNVVKRNITSADNSNTQLFTQGNMRNENQANNVHQSAIVNSAHQSFDERNLLDSDDDDIFLNIQPDTEAVNQNNAALRNNQEPTNRSNNRGNYESIDLLDDDIDIPFENGDIYENNVASNLNNLKVNEERNWLNDDGIVLDDIEAKTLSFPCTSPPQHNISRRVPRSSDSVPKESSRPQSTSTASDNKTSASEVKSTPSEPSSSSSITTGNRRTDEYKNEHIPMESTITADCKVEKWKTKLLVEDGNWGLKVSLLIVGQKVVDASFDVDVLNKIIGFSYAEMMARDREIAVNPALKERFEKIELKSTNNGGWCSIVCWNDVFSYASFWRTMW
ncbi:hypothetical protein LSTR_LSTR001625 [Laodelphax striatellus]|uniref:RecQ-mediated genome instability protein 1 n=1 Tax=Laodelphax striatellus TaxID=195883 RepID=A0A482XBZ8_LAOST|nr:hypothetical protein LSTR_LSTR001625 [Laodelphax striatellus]